MIVLRSELGRCFRMRQAMKLCCSIKDETKPSCESSGLVPFQLYETLNDFNALGKIEKIDSRQAKLMS